MVLTNENRIDHVKHLDKEIERKPSVVLIGHVKHKSELNMKRDLI